MVGVGEGDDALRGFQALIQRRDDEAYAGVIGICHPAQRVSWYLQGITISNWFRGPSDKMIDLAPKGTDYGDAAKGDFLANVRVAEQWGVPPWLGVMIRATDKVTRLQSYAKTGHLANEGAEDSLMDLAAYSIIALILLREEDQ